MRLDFSQTKIRRGRSITSYNKVRELIGYVIRNRGSFADRKKPGCYLDLGCGPNIDPEFCNLDYGWRPGVDVCWDVTKGLPFSDGYIGGIFTEHMIEHISFDQALSLLGECRRVLRKGGTLRVIVPDGGIYLAEYAKHIAYGPTNPNAYKNISKERATILPTNPDHFDKLIYQNHEYWGPNQEKMIERFNTWILS